MGFKFDNDDDELSLDVGGDTAKTQRPAPLPPQPKPVAEEETAARPSIPTKPSKVEPTSDVLKNLPQPGQSVSNPAQDATGLSSLLDNSLPQQPVQQPVYQEPVVQPEPVQQPIYQEPEPVQQPVYQEPTHIEEPEEEPQSTLNINAVPVSNKSRRYDVSAEPESFENLQSQNVLNEDDSRLTLTKSKGSPFSGARKKVIRVRIIFGVFLAFLVLSGVYSFLPKPGFTSDVTAQSLAVTNGNKYESIRQASEAHALKLMTDLLHRPNYTVEQSLADRIAVYVNDAQLKAILPNFQLAGYEITSFEGRNQGNYYQEIISGPFIENQEVITTERITRLDVDQNGTNESYIYTVRVSAYIQYIVDKDEAKAAVEKPVAQPFPKWVYYVVPVVYNSETKTVHLYELPSITSAPPLDDYEIYSKLSDEEPFAEEDKELNSNGQFLTAVKGFITAWAEQPPVSSVDKVGNVLKNMLSFNIIKDKTDPRYPKYRIARGLGQTYSLSDSDTNVRVKVEALTEEQIASEDTTNLIRKMIVEVEWVDNTLPDGSSVFKPIMKQQYVVIFMGTNPYYFIDIRPLYSE